MEDLYIFIAVFVMVIIPFAVLMWAIGKQLNEHEEGIRDLKARVKELEGNIPIEENRPCCQNCKHLVNDTCVLHSNDYHCLICVDNDFKDFEVK